MSTLYGRFHQHLDIDSKHLSTFVFGVNIFLILSFYRGFITVSLAYILSRFGQTGGVGLALIPILSIFIPKTIITRTERVVSNGIVIWFICIFIQDLLIKYILILIGMAFTFQTLKFQLMKFVKNETIAFSVIIGLILDLSIKSLNYGEDPLVIIHVFGFIGSLLLTVLVVYILNHNWNKINNIQTNSPTTYPIFVPALAILGSVLNIFIYFAFFGNPGIVLIIFHSDNFMFLPLFFIFSFIFIYLGYLVYSLNTMEDMISNMVASIILVISVVTFPWFWPRFIIWGLGLISLTYLTMWAISYSYTNLELMLSTILFVSFVLLLGLIFSLISQDGSNVPLISGIIAGGCLVGSALFVGEIKEGGDVN